jgi:hypothetical protein
MLVHRSPEIHWSGQDLRRNVPSTMELVSLESARRAASVISYLLTGSKLASSSPPRQIDPQVSQRNSGLLRRRDSLLVLHSRQRPVARINGWMPQGALG